MSSTVLQTERLILRPIDAERDFEPWLRTMSDPATVRYLAVEPMDRVQAWRSMATVIGHRQIRGYGSFSVEHRESGEWVGVVGPWYPEGWPFREIAWTLSPDHRGHGYATEAARAAVDHAFGTLGWPRVSHVILEGNDASVAVAERIGSKLIRRESKIEGVSDGPASVYGQDAP